MGKPIFILAGQSNAYRLANELKTSLDAEYGAGNYVLVEVYAAGAPITRALDGYDDWVEAGELQDQLAQRTISALAANDGTHVEGVFWLQGEADSYTYNGATTYRRNFLEILDRFETTLVERFGAGVTGVEEAEVVISELSDHAPAAPLHAYWSEIIDVQKALADRFADVLSVDPDVVAAATGFALDEMFADGLHYSDAFSQDLADALVSALSAADASGLQTRYGTSRSDYFAVEKGAERMIGGAGDDVYQVDDPNDVVVEAQGDGIDKVVASVSFSLRENSQHIETLRLGGSGDIDGTGNGQDNRIVGGAGDNALNGAWGDDVLVGRDGNDTFYDDAGADKMVGGTGNDTYFVDNPGDRIVEEKREGTDSVVTRVSIDLRDHSGYLEKLWFAGADDIDGFGNGQANLIVGNDGQNRIRGRFGDDDLRGGAGKDELCGGHGRDVLRGGAGNDRLFGGAGADVFVFTDWSGRDRIDDFSATPRGDRLDLSRVSAIDAWNDLLAHHLSIDGGDLLIDLGSGGEIRLSGLAPDDLTAENILF